MTTMSGDGDLIGWMAQCSGRSTGLEAADCICQQHATIWGNLSGTYKAWLSDSITSAESRLSHSTVPYVNRRGESIVTGWAGLASAPCSGRMSYSESGDLVGDYSSLVWTGSDSSGAPRSPAQNCNDWTNGSIGYSGWVGSSVVDSYRANFPDCWSEWVDGGGWRDCDLSYRLYVLRRAVRQLRATRSARSVPWGTVTRRTVVERDPGGRAGRRRGTA